MITSCTFTLNSGPIVEQATHFCDLVRYLGGEVNMDTVRACCVPYSSDPASPGYLSAVPANIDEGRLAPRQRNPRCTAGTDARTVHNMPLFPAHLCLVVLYRCALHCALCTLIIEMYPSSLLPAHWVFESGGVGSLVHGATLQGRCYEASFDVWADGLRMSLEDPYTEKCTLRVRQGMKSVQMHVSMEGEVSVEVYLSITF